LCHLPAQLLEGFLHGQSRKGFGRQRFFQSFRMSANISGELAINALIEALWDADRRVRWACVHALEKLQDRKAVDFLLKLLVDIYEENRKKAAEALAKLGEPKWTSIVLGDKGDFTRLRMNPDLRICSNLGLLLGIANNGAYHEKPIAIDALGRLGNPAAVEPLIHMLKNVISLSADTIAVALGQIKDTRAVDALLDAVQSETMRLRCAAIWALGELGDQKAVGPLIMQLEGFNFTERLLAAGALAKIGDSQAAAKLADLFSHSDHYWMRKTLAEALDQLGEGSFIDGMKEEIAERRRHHPVTVKEGAIPLTDYVIKLTEYALDDAWMACYTEEYSELDRTIFQPYVQMLRFYAVFLYNRSRNVSNTGYLMYAHKQLMSTLSPGEQSIADMLMLSFEPLLHSISGHVYKEAYLSELGRTFASVMIKYDANMFATLGYEQFKNCYMQCMNELDTFPIFMD